MPTKITVGLQQKVGRPNFGSLGASCHLELSLDEHDARDPERLRTQVQDAFAVCRLRITEALQQAAAETTESSLTGPTVATASTSTASRNGRPPRPATPAQLRAIHAIIGRRGLSLAEQLQTHFGHQSLQQLSLQQASQLIDVLNSELVPG